MSKEQFSYLISKDRKLFVAWYDKQDNRELVLKGPRAEKLVQELPAMNAEQQQLALAPVTDNFKRGNEHPFG